MINTLGNIWIIAVGIVFVVIVGLVFIYNRFIALVNRVQESWSDIEVQFKRRYDLIPNLIETVKGYAKHERETLEKVTEMRQIAVQQGGGSPTDKARSENMLTDALKSLFAVSENYPDLKANQNFLNLQQELTDTENKVQAARRFYNSTVQDYNTMLQQFPYNMIGSVFNFTEKDFFEINEEEKEMVQKPVPVSF